MAFTCELLHSRLVTIRELYLSIICDIVVCVVGEFNHWQIWWLIIAHCISFDFGKFLLHLYVRCRICLPNFWGISYGSELLFKEYSFSTELKEPFDLRLVFCVALLIRLARTEVSAFCFSLKMFTQQIIYIEKLFTDILGLYYSCCFYYSCLGFQLHSCYLLVNCSKGKAMHYIIISAHLTKQFTHTKS